MKPARKALCSAAALLLASFAAAAPATAQLRNDPILIAGGDPTGVYFQAAGAVCRVLEDTDIGEQRGCAVLPTRGSLDNLNILKEGRADFAVVQADTQFTAVVGLRPSRLKTRFETLNSVLGLYAEDLAIVTGPDSGPDSGIETLDDLKGKALGVGRAGSGTEHFLEIVLKAVGFENEDMETFQALGPFDMAQALCAGEIDAVAFVAGHPNLAIQRAMSACNAALLPIEGPDFEILTAGYPFIEQSTIPARTYDGLETDVPTLSVRAVLVSREDVPVPMVSQLARAVFDTLDTLKLNYPRFFELTPESMTQGDLYAPLHEGVDLVIDPPAN